MKLILTRISVCLMLLISLSGDLYAESPKSPPKKVIARTVRYDIPSGYEQVGATDVYCRKDYQSIDIIGRFGEQYYSSTYSDNGYRLAMQVGSGYAVGVDCLEGTEVDGVLCQVSVTQQGEFARVVYTVTNTNKNDTVISLGTHADVMIGNNDGAPISRRIDTIGNTYGLTMKDGNGAELCVLFGSGLVGVNSVSDFWFGHYGLNGEPYQMVGEYSSGSNYMEENGGYDSGMGWCWKNRTIPAYGSVEFSYLIGVGEVNLEPNSSFEVTPDDPDGWNDLSRPHRLSLEGLYESPAGQRGKIQYAVEDSEDWEDLTEEIESGSTFTASLVAVFDESKETHSISFRTMDAVGNTSMLSPIIYKDVRFHEVEGIEEKVYNWGDSIFQNNLTCDLPAEQYRIAGYRNNVNAGTATFSIEGVFPYSIGQKSYSYTILPLSVDGELILEQNELVYDGSPQCPVWRFSEESFTSLEMNSDYTVEWHDNIRPGTGQLTVKGKGNFTNELSANFIIDKAPLGDNLYTITLPTADVTYDSASHGAYIEVSEGVGMPKIFYSPAGMDELSEEAPVEEGKYDIFVEFADGEFYYGKEREKVFTFTIFNFDVDDWRTVLAIGPFLAERGGTITWDLSGGIATASHLDGLIIEEGKVVGLDLSNFSLSGNFPGELLSFSHLRTLDISGNSFGGQIEAVAAYAQQNPIMFANISKLDISDNSFTGNLGLFAACFPKLSYLNASGNHLSDIYPMISEKVEYLDISTQTIDVTVEFNISQTSIEDLMKQIPTILIYDHAGQSYTKPLLLKCSAGDNFSMTFAYHDGAFGITDVSYQNVYHGKNGDILDLTAMSSDGTTIGAKMKIMVCFDKGDCNFDGLINILDLQSTILFAFDEYGRYPFNFTAADTFEDDKINVQDVICTANILLGINNRQMPAQTRRSSKVQPEESEAYAYISDGKLYLESTRPVAAIDLQVDGPIDWKLGEFGMESVSTRRHLVGYSMSGMTLPTGSIVLGEVEEDSTILNCVLSDAEAQSISVSTNLIPSGIDIPESSEGGDSLIYDLNGRRINSLGGGINIVVKRDGSQKTVKMIK